MTCRQRVGNGHISLRPQRPRNSEKWRKLRFHNVRVFKSNDLIAEYSLAVVEHRGGYTLNAAKFLLQVIGSDRQWITNSDLLRKLDWIFRIHHHVEFESHYRKSARAIAIQEFLIAGHLFLAWLAPRGPKINKHHLAAEIGRGKFVSLQVFDREVRQPRTNFAWRDHLFFWQSGTRRMLITSGESN